MADFSALKTSIQNYIKQNGNEEITGNLLQQILLSMVTTLGDSAINDLVTALNAEIANRGNADTTLQGNIDNEATARGNADTELGGRITTLQGVVNGIVANVENGYVYAGIATPSTTPVSGKVFYLALTAGTYTNFGATVVPQGINILKYNGSAWSLDSFLGLDDAPTQGSSNLVKSGGVLDSIIKDGSAFDLSAYNNGTTYADLSAALTALNALPAAYKKGGMSFKYVQTSDNTYIQARCMAQDFTTDVTQWQGVDDEPTAGSDNLVKSGGVSYEFSKREGISNNSDFEINDDNSFSIVKFQNGHVKTKYFNSSLDASPTLRGLMSANDKTKLDSIEDGAEVNDVYTENDCYSDFEINDNNSFSIVKFIDGHIKTKNFDSKLLVTNKFKGKYMSIIGDSVSSFNEDIYRPSNKYSTAYPNLEYYDITSVDQMWWKIVCDNLEINPLRNASWGGTSVCGVPNNSDGNCGCCQKRIDDLTDGINNPDIVMIAMGINDFVDLGQSITVGTFDADAPFPTPVDNVAINVFADAYALMINRIQIKYPNAKIFCLTMYPFFKSTATTGTYPCKNKENELLITYNNIIKTICDDVGINLIDVHRCGISKENIENYTGELLHLNAAGQSLVARYVIGNLISKF